MSTGWEGRKAWADKFTPDVRRILGEMMTSTATLKQDREEATDLVIFSTGEMRIAMRVRDWQYSTKYPYDVTVRSRNPTPAFETELQKFQGGFCHYFFYGFGDPQTCKVTRWAMIDVARLADASTSSRWPTKVNPDGTGFTAFDLRQIPFVVRRHSDGYWNGDGVPYAQVTKRFAKMSRVRAQEPRRDASGPEVRSGAQMSLWDRLDPTRLESA